MPGPSSPDAAPRCPPAPIPASENLTWPPGPPPSPCFAVEAGPSPGYFRLSFLAPPGSCHFRSPLRSPVLLLCLATRSRIRSMGTSANNIWLWFQNLWAYSSQQHLRRELRGSPTFRIWQQGTSQPVQMGSTVAKMLVKEYSLGSLNRMQRHFSTQVSMPCSSHLCSCYW